MSFSVMHTDPLRRAQIAIDDIRAGKMVILVDDEDRENEGDLCMAAELVTPEAINFMATYGRGLICMPITEQQVDRLNLAMMAPDNRSPYQTGFTVAIEAREGVSTGISAHDRAHTIRVAIDPEVSPRDIVTPGHVFPLRARDGGVLVRTGQTEGSVDLARLAGLNPAGVICEIMNEDGTMARLPDLERFGARHQLHICTVADIIRWRMRNEVLVERLLEGDLPMRGLPGFKVRTYRSLSDGALHMAVWMGEWEPEEPVMVRLQATCVTGDIFGALSCDCGAQLDAALEAIAAQGKGLLVYLHVGAVGRGQDLVDRMRGHLRVASPSNELPKGGELREMGTGAQILVDMGVSHLRLMTNNPRKIVGLEGYGVQVAERLPLEIPSSADNASFLEARRQSLGHLISKPSY